MDYLQLCYERNGTEAKPVLEYFLKRIYPDTEIRWIENDKTSDVIVYSIYGKKSISKSKSYIGFSGESFLPPLVPVGLKPIYLLSHIEKSNINYLHLPYFLSSPYLYKEPIDKSVKRPFLLAYCNTNPIQQRESFFHATVQKSSAEVCHSLGKCNGGLEDTVRYIEGDWKSEKLIEQYTNYKFIIAMENKQVEGYVTEKILNAFYAGAIPIYWGAPDINKYFNPNAFINLSDFRSIHDCVDYIISMTDEQRKKMTEEPIYANTDIAFLMYDKDQNNELREKYTEKIKNFLINTNILRSKKIPQPRRKKK